LARVKGERAVSTRKVPAGAGWTFFSNHSHVLFCLARFPDHTLRQVAEQVGITERAVQRIVAELEDAGVVVRERDGRRNRYTIQPDVRLRHPIEGHCRLADLIELVVSSAPPEASSD
jgi:DNA-binding transcriptional ArsR family regulator